MTCFQNERNERWRKGAATVEYVRIHLPGFVIKLGKKSKQLMVCVIYNIYSTKSQTQTEDKFAYINTNALETLTL